MTAPVVILGVLTVVAGWLNLPAIAEGWSIGKTERLTECLEPVTGMGTRVLSGDAHLSHETEYMLIAAAVAVGVLGMLISCSRDKAACFPWPVSLLDKRPRRKSSVRLESSKG